MKRLPWHLIVMACLTFGCLALPRESTPPPVDQTCTAMGCGFTLQIELLGSVPSEFVLRVTSANRDTVSVHCRVGAVVYDGETTTGVSSVCGANQVAFLNFSPEELTVSIESQGVNTSQEYHPDYSVFRPNGPGCDPECHSAILEFRVPDP